MRFRIDEKSTTPKFMQMVETITRTVREGRLKRGDALPSVLDICGETGMARATVFKAYGILKQRGVIRAVPQKGYFVATEDVSNTLRVLLLFDELPPYKQELYEAFRAELGARPKIDIMFHHCDIRVFATLLTDRADYYDRIAVMPFAHPRVTALIRKIPATKVILLDRCEAFLAGEFQFVGQNFESELTAALDSAWDRIGRYRRMILVMPKNLKAVAMKSSQAPGFIPSTVREFCTTRNLPLVVVADSAAEPPVAGDLWFVIDDCDLVTVVEAANARNMVIGKDLGILAYNETAMRRIAANGITTVSTDFAAMGRRLAQVVLSADPVWETIPTRIYRRNSL
jgi:DNA-binding transcriptional regulator YhcF (GntR family)